jgi:MoaA/NifB/PqqE/SkfB family radical SAM enzyme
MWRKKAPPEMNTEQALDVVRQLAELNVLHVSISGGETFLRRDIFEILAALKREGLKVSVNTNAWLLDEQKVARLCELGVESTYVSLDGATPETNDKVRGMQGGYQKALDVVRLFAGTNSRNGAKVFINTTINHINLPELENLADVVAESGADGWTMSVVQNVDIYKPEEAVLLTALDVDRLKAALGRIQENHASLLPHMQEYFANLENSVLSPDRLYKYRCVAGYLTLMIHPNGDVFPCPVAFAKAGNVLETPLKGIWRDGMQDIRERIKAGKHPMCWFDCIAPLNVLMHYVKPVRWHRLLRPSLVKYLIHKAV